MSLLLEHRWEHALVGAVVEAAKKACPNCYLGRTAIQKLVYFLQVLDVPMQYRFRIHNFGPFCGELAGTLDWLQADDIVVDDSTEPRYSNFSTGSNWPVVKGQFETELEKHQEIVDTVAKAMGSMDPRTLELIATLDYSFRWVHARGEEGPWRQDAIRKFKEIKKDKFDDNEIDHWYDALVEVELIDA